MLSHVARGQESVGSVRATSQTTIALERVEGALVVCNESGLVLGASPSAHELLARMGQNAPASIASELWDVILAQDPGEPTQWRPSGDGNFMLRCTRYRLDAHWLLIMSEISQQQSALAHRLHHERLESLGRVVATAVHDLRAPLSSIVFGIDVLAQRAGELPRDRTREIVSDVRIAAFCLRETIDRLLDFVRLGPPLPSEISIKQVLSRMQSVLRPQLRMGPHELVLEVEADVFVTGNLLTIEQIFVNLVVNSIEAAARPTKVRVSTRSEGKRLRVLVEDDGPGIRPDLRQLVFEPMFSTKERGVGLGLTSAREAARSVGGDIQLVRWSNGSAFVVFLPIGPRQSVAPSHAGPPAQEET